MLSTVLGIVMAANSWQPRNVYLSIFVMPSGRLIALSPEQSLNAASPMLFTVAGRVTCVRLLQSENAPTPMVVTPLGIVTPVRLSHPENALFAMTCMPVGIVNSPSLSLGRNTNMASLNSGLVKAVPSKTTSPISIIPLGRLTEDRLLQSWKASGPMYVTVFGIVTSVIVLIGENASFAMRVTV